MTNLVGFLFIVVVLCTAVPACMSSMCKCLTRHDFGISKIVDCINSTVPGGFILCHNRTVHESPDNLRTLFQLSCYAGYRAVFAFNKSSEYCKVNNCSGTAVDRVVVETASNRILGLMVIGTCQEITNYCPPIPSIRSGTIRYPQYRVGARAYLSCNLGYNLSNTSKPVMSCISHNHLQGIWWPAPSCQSIPDYCPSLSLPSISNGKIQATTNQVNATATVSCNPGYILRGSSTVRCQTNNKNEGIWSTIPSCQAISDYCPLPSIPDGKFQATANHILATATVVCNAGYILSRSNSSVTCLSGNTTHGRWSIILSCLSIFNYCPVAPSIANGQIQATTSHIGATATVVCNRGFILNGSSSIRCLNDSQSHGRWSTVPSCPLKLDYCSVLPNIINGQVQATAFHMHATATVVCDQGYTLSGSSTVHCTARNRNKGRWSSLPLCLMTLTTAPATHLPSTTTHPPQTTATTILTQSTTQPTTVTTPPTTQQPSPTILIPVTSLPMPATDLDQHDTMATSAPASTASEATSAPAALSSAPWISTTEQSPSPGSNQATPPLNSIEATPSSASQNAVKETSTDTIMMTRPVIIAATTKVQDVETDWQTASSSPDNMTELIPVFKPKDTDASSSDASTKWIGIGGGVGAGLLLLAIGLVSVSRNRRLWNRYQIPHELYLNGTKSTVSLRSMVSNTVNGGSPLGDLTRTPSMPNLYSQSPLGGSDTMSVFGAQLFRSQDSTPLTTRQPQPLPAETMQATVPLVDDSVTNAANVTNTTDVTNAANPASPPADNNYEVYSANNNRTMPTSAFSYTAALGGVESLAPAPSSTTKLQSNCDDIDPQDVAMTQDPTSDHDRTFRTAKRCSSLAASLRRSGSPLDHSEDMLAALYNEVYDRISDMQKMKKPC